MLGLVKAIAGVGEYSLAASNLGAASKKHSDELHRSVATEIASALKLGIDPMKFASATVSGDPPPLPALHISRISAFSQIARLFDVNRVAGVADYSESGKSTTVAEYASFCNSQVFWFTAFDELSSDDTWLAIFSLSLSTKFGTPTLRIENLAHQISAYNHKLLIVIDDAHRVQDFRSLSQLLAAVKANGNVSLLLVGIDVPDFVSTLRSNGIEAARIPGLTEVECRKLCGISPEDRTWQTVALESLRVRCGGHIGLLRLGWPDIQSLDSDEECIQYLADLPEGVGIGLEAMQSALIERLRNGLADDESLLCRRLSLAITSFHRQVGEAVWTLDREFAQFQSVWGRCVRKVFEGKSPGRFAIPEVYESGFRRELSTEEQRGLHAVIAEAFQNQVSKSKDVFDVHASVFHRLLGGDPERAMHDASMYITYASGPGASQVQLFLLRRFEVLFSSIDESQITNGLVLWHSTRTRAYSELNDDSAAKIAAEKLHQILLNAESDQSCSAHSETRQLGWLSLLLHAAKNANPDLALKSASRIDRTKSHLIPALPVRWDAFLVLSACLPSNEPILPCLAHVVNDAVAASFEDWFGQGTIHAYEFWRVVSTRVYGDINRLPRESVQTEIELLASIVEMLWQGDVPDVAAIIECALIRVEIDVQRDFDRAERLSRELVEKADRLCDQEVQVHVLQTRADALRCKNQDLEAIKVYQSAIDRQPESDWSEEADLYLLLAISQAKAGQWIEAIKTADHSGSLFSARTDGDASLNRLSAAKSWLEAAAFAVHGGTYHRAAGLLIKAYHALTSEHRNDPLWAVLAQISWALVNRMSPDPASPEPPAPGFSITLTDNDELRNMQRSAVPLMLGRVCTVVGRPFRAIEFFEQSIDESHDSDNRSSGAFFGIDAALQAKHIVTAARYSTLTANWMAGQADFEGVKGKRFVYDWVLGRTFRLIAEGIGSHSFDVRLDQVIERVTTDSKSSAPELLFQECIEALRMAVNSLEWSDLESAFRACEAKQAAWLAKELAWIACYRCAPKQMTEGDFFIWHWRVVRWSLIVGDNDPAYLTSVFQQQRDYWSRIPQDGSSARVSRVVQALESESEDAAGLRRVASVLSRESMGILSVESAVRETISQLAMSGGESVVGGALEELSLRLLDRCLDPLAYKFAQTLVDQIQPICDVLVGKDDLALSAVEYGNLLALAKSLNSGDITDDAYRAIRRVVDTAESMTPDSAAQGFVYLRHWLQFAPEDFGYEKIAEELARARVRRILDSGDLRDFMRIRLVVAHLASVAFEAQRNLSNALAQISTQIQARTPIAHQAFVGARQSAGSSMQVLESSFNELEIAAAQADASGFHIEKWSALFELGGILQMLGVTILRFTNDQTAVDTYLRRASDVFRRAVESIPNIDEEQSAEMISKAAFPGRTLAKELGDEQSLQFFQKAIDRITAHSQYGAVVRRQEERERHNIVHMLKQSDNDGLASVNDADFEKYVENFVDHMMKSTGWPEDRRKNVEDDFRKLRFFEAEKQMHCRHLEPLQDLRHTQHPDTAYAEPTNYVIRCALLGSQTQIGVTDMSLAIGNMKSTFCQGCKHRAPLKPPSPQSD